MPASSEFEPKRTELSTQDLPEIPAVQDMITWNKDKVLRWIQQRDPNILEEDDVDYFKEQCIIGRAFLASSVEFFHRSCRLPPGVGLALQDLVEEVKRGGKFQTPANSVKGNLSNQTAGRKRKADETDAPEPAISTKINRQQNPLSKLAAQAREQRKRIKEIITDINGSSGQHSNSVEPANPLPGAVDQLSDPTFERTLPFPFVGFKAPVRFKVVEGNWQYVGRTKFKELLQKFHKQVQRNGTYSTVWLYGTPGYGKSHLLAALVCYLTAQDERVVYISDCEALLEDPVGYLRASMLFAWADDIVTQEIMTLNTLEEIEQFFYYERKAIFVIDQMNALEIDSPGEKKKRKDLSDRIGRFTYGRKKVYCTSANNTNYPEENEDTKERILPVYGGLTETEMDQWWKRHSDIDRGGYEKRDVEDVTGCIPLLLDKCVVDKKIDLTVKDLRDIYDKAADYTQQVKERIRPSRWNWYYDYVRACFLHDTTPLGRHTHLDLIDHRYFYELDYEHNYNQGRSTCSLACGAVGDQLLTWNEGFASTDFLVLSRRITNLSLGFMIEYAVLSSIRSNGLAISAEIGKAMKVRLLEDLSDIETNIINTAVLYRPKKFKFKAIDGMIVLIKPGEKNAKKLLMFPLRITLAPADHTNSREQFFKEYGWWITGLSNFDVEVQFLWITPEYRDSQEYPASIDPEWPKHVERYVPLRDVNQHIWEKYEDAQRLQKNKGSSIKAVPERAATKKATAKAAAAKKAAGKKAAAKADV